MKKIISLTFSLLIILSIPIFVFGAELTRDEAKKKLQNLPVQYIQRSLSHIYEMDYKKEGDILNKFEQEGYIKLIYWPYNSRTVREVIINPKLKEYIVKTDQYSAPDHGKNGINYTLLYGWITPKNITGIKKSGPEERTVYYDCYLKRTPIGNIIPLTTLYDKEPTKCSMKFELYDDGWRYAKNSNDGLGNLDDR